ncbi:fibrinogen-like protein A [Aedes albopictus]|uniref:Fibrinogen C-terminal domain-containing protein n=1 Tax=Aedes albopictus TaxID=7160 RepID=A0ABM1Z1J6_AEDAL|nr:fibrinogen-like protein A [Aedes albopictus]
MNYKLLQLFTSIALRKRLTLDCRRMKVTILIIICVLCAMHHHEATKVSNNCSNCPVYSSDSFGYEVLIGKLEHLEAKLDERFTRLEKVVDHNLTTVMDRSSEILQICQSSASSSLVFKSCAENPSYVSGKYKVRPLSFEEPFEAYCEQEAFDGGWIVVQYRFDGSVNFHRNWTEYRNGFGSLDGEFWIGLEKLHRLTKGGDHQLLVELKDFNGNYKFARYEEFVIGTEGEKYALKKLGNYSGTAGDSLGYHKSKPFSTEDNDNDDADGGNCAKKYKCGWWFMECYYCNLNGLYKSVNDTLGLTWYRFNKSYNVLAYSRVMVRKTKKM